MNETYIYNPVTESDINFEDIHKENTETQIEIMKAWFFSNYADPVHECPYISKEGGYQFIYGGPYEANDVLQDMFYTYVDDSVVEQLSNELDELCWQWSAVPTADFYDDYLFNGIESATDPKGNFYISKTEAVSLCNNGCEPYLAETFYRMLFVHLVTLFETYMSEIFIQKVVDDEDIFKRFVKHNSDYQKQKIPVSDIYDKLDTIKDDVKTHLLNITWHNMGKTMPIFKSTLKVKFPDNMDWLHQSIKTRHDIVHRNGKSTDGVKCDITSTQLLDLAEKLQALIFDLDAQINTPHP